MSSLFFELVRHLTLRRLHPDELSRNKLLYVSDCLTPRSGGSGVVNSMLIRQLGAVHVIAVTSSGEIDTDTGVPAETAGFNYSFLPKRLLMYGHLISVLLARYKISLLIRRYKPACIIAAYPQLSLFSAAVKEANQHGIPYYAYLHDTIEEALSRGPLKGQAAEIQQVVFQTAAGIFVISDGMQELYARKYRLETTVVRHIYPEEGFPITSSGNGRAFWSGSVYGINHRALARMTHTCTKVGMSTTFTGNTPEKDLHLFGFPTDSIHRHYYSRRNDYLLAVAEHSLLLLCLNWPDESSVHPDEMATIFPTKTPEFLASGVPVVVHCPDNYFLANFFRENACGLVISTRDEKKIMEELEGFMANKSLQQAMVARARMLKHLFDPELNAGNMKNMVFSANQLPTSHRENSLDSQ